MPTLNRRAVTRLVAAARDLLEGRIGILEGSRTLTGLMHQCGLEGDNDLIILQGVDSESDRFPLGPVRNLWDPKALAELDPEIAAESDSYRGVVVRACELIVERYSRTRTRRDAVEVDVSAVTSTEELHAALSRALELPDYPNSWDAFG